MPSWDHSIDYRDWKLVITGNIQVGVCFCHLAFQTTCTSVIVGGRMTAYKKPHATSYSELHVPDYREVYIEQMNDKAHLYLWFTQTDSDPFCISSNAGVPMQTCDT